MIQTLDPQQFAGIPVDDPASPEQVARAARDYQLMVLAGLDLLLSRSEARPDYGFVDTKFSLLDGRDFDEADPIRGRGTVYGWIQGRALEALAGHASYLERAPGVDKALRKVLLARVEPVLRRLVERTEKVRAANGGRLYFMMDEGGRPLQLQRDGRAAPWEPPADTPANFTDLFYAKGLAAAAAWLRDARRIAAARTLFDRVLDDIRHDRFLSDQVPLHPDSPATRPIPGRHAHGPRMIALGGLAVLLSITRDPAYLATGIEFIDHILKRHVNLAGMASAPVFAPAPPERGAQPFEMWEFVDDAGRPYAEEDGTVRCVPGHATEFVGLALRLIRVADRLGVPTVERHRRLAEFKRVLPEVLAATYRIGMSPDGHGLVNAYDLAQRRVAHPNMPWWALPETIRAAVLSCPRVKAAHKPVVVRIAAQCSNAFVRGFVRRERGLMAVQTLGPEGQPTPAIPAVPDADPLYHTGLSVIDALDALVDCGVAGEG